MEKRGNIVSDYKFVITDLDTGDTCITTYSCNDGFGSTEEIMWVTAQLYRKIFKVIKRSSFKVKIYHKNSCIFDNKLSINKHWFE
jgi:hypothetical protein